MQKLLDFGALLERFNVNKQMIGLTIVTFIVVMIVWMKSISSTEIQEEEIQQPAATSEVALQKEEATEESAAQSIKVDVKGAVKYSGVYDARQGERVHDVLKHAEVLPNADLDAVNLSQEVSDALVIYIPFKGEVKTDKYTLYQNTGGYEGNSGSNVQKKININQAEQSELEEIPGIGPKKAQDIIKYRTDNKGFKAIEEIKEIRGVGDKTYEGLKDYIEV